MTLAGGYGTMPQRVDLKFRFSGRASDGDTHQGSHGLLKRLGRLFLPAGFGKGSTALESWIVKFIGYLPKTLEC